VKNKVFIFLIILSFAIRFVLLYINNIEPKILNINFLQDNYFYYAHALDSNTLSIDNNPDSRFFPWYPTLILFLSKVFFIPFSYSGLIINFLSLIGSVLIFWKLSKDRLATLLFCFIPTIWFIAPIKIATESLTVFLLLISLYLYHRKRLLLTGVVLGLASGVRPISVCLLISLIIVLLKNKNIFKIIKGFLASFALIFIYNFFVFKDLFYQFKIYPKIGGASGSSLGFIQIFNDIFRALDWHQYRILTSGLIYILSSFIITYFLYKFRKKKEIYKISFYWSFFSLLFIFSFGPNPLLEEFRRFIIPFLPALILGLVEIVKKYF
jgi:Gpi18-like mannosyltransferase